MKNIVITGASRDIDVWFQEAKQFIEQTKEEPFFVYLPTNAPHSPFYVDEKYINPYKSLVGKDIVNAEFYGMITNIDENFGKLEAFLTLEEKLDLVRYVQDLLKYALLLGQDVLLEIVTLLRAAQEIWKTI